MDGGKSDTRDVTIVRCFCWVLWQIDTPDVTFQLESGDVGVVARLCELIDTKLQLIQL